MGKEKKGTSLNVAEADVDFEKSVDKLVEAIAEDVKEGYQSDLEPFEGYVQKVRAEVHSNMEEFRNRFLHGYEVLLKEISSQSAQESESNEKKPPPGSIKL